MSVRVRVSSDFPKLDGLADSLLDELRPQVERIVERGGAMAKDKMDEILSRVGPPKPGAPPAQVKGALRRGLTATKPKWRGLTVFVDVGIPKEAEGGEYAGRQEFGGVDSEGRYLPAHPFARPAMVAIRPEIDALVGDGT